MMKAIHAIQSVAAASAALLLGSCAITGSAPLTPDSPPSGSVRFNTVQVLAYGSAQRGDGVLKFRGRHYPFTVRGLGAGGMGFQSLAASGNVYNLERVSDFPGVYAQARMGLSVGSGRSSMWLKNENGVTMLVKARTRGIALATGAEGVRIEFK